MFSSVVDRSRGCILRIFLIILSLLAGWYLFSTLRYSMLSAQENVENPSVSFEPARFVGSNYHFYPVNKHIKHRAIMIGYRQHLNTYWNLSTKESAGQLEVKMNIPPVHEGYTFNLRNFRYKTVSRIDDCQINVFSGRYSSRLENPQTSISIPLTATDYDRYYCFNIDLHVEKSSSDFYPWGVFVVERTVQYQLRMPDLPGLTQAVKQDTYYDYGTGLSRLDYGGNDINKDRYYNHLNHYFTLHTRRINDHLYLRLNLPGRLDLEDAKDINDFFLERVDYKTVTSRDDCNWIAFEGSADIDRFPYLSTSMLLDLDSSSNGLYYCLKVSLKGDISMRRDEHPYRIFFVPQQINEDQDTANEDSNYGVITTSTSRHRVRLGR